MEDPTQQQDPTTDPTKPTSVDEYRKALEDDMRKQGVIPDPNKADHPTSTFMQRLIHGVPGTSRTEEIARSIGRGATGAIKELQTTTGQIGAALGHPEVAKAGELGSKLTGAVQNIFGAESEDPLGSFTEGVTQFVLPFMATGPLGIESKLGTLVGGAARGAAVDATSFDPHSGSITDLLKLIPGDGAAASAARAAGDMLHVEGDDSNAVAHLKYAASGVLPGVAVDAIVAGSRLIRGKTTGDAAKVAANTKILQDIADGTHVPEGAHVIVKPTEDGGFQVTPTNGEKIPEAPKFETKAQADAQAETINFAMDEHMTAAKNAGGLSEGDAQQVRDVFHRMVSSPGPVDMQKLVEGTHFNFSYMNEPTQTLAMIESISEVFEKEINAAKGVDGVSHARQIEMANEILGGVSKDQVPAVMAKSVANGSTASLPARLLAANYALREIGGKAAKLFDMIEARPNDPILWEQGRFAARSMLELQEALSSASSNTGRALEIHKAFDEMAASGGATTKVAKEINPGIKPSFDSPKAKVLSDAQDAEKTQRVSDTKESVKKAKESIAKAKKDAANPGPNTLTVADEAALPPSKGKPATSGPIQKQGLDGSRDTQGVTANDFSRSRERSEAIAALRKAQAELKDHGVIFDPEVLSDNRSLRGEKVKMQSEAQLANPLQAEPSPTKASKNPIEELSNWLDSADEELSKVLKKRDTPAEAKTHGQKLPEEVSPFTTHLNETKAGRVVPDPVAGMDQREIQNVLRMAKMAGGEPRNLFSVGHAAKMVKENGMGRKVLEFFVNSLLSSPTTAGTALVMNAAESTYRAASKMIGGAVSLNGPMMREGWDILYANERYLADNFKTAVAAARAGRSIINPSETHVAIGGALGDAIRTPSKALIFTDEFTRVANYRSYIRSKSLRYWREKGLDGKALYGQVEQDLGAAFDKNTGIATIPSALKYAEGPTFSAPLEGNIGKNLSTFLNNTVEAKFVAPFVKTSINIFNMTWDRTPALNMFLKRNRDVLMGKMGKEAAADLWAQTSMAGSTYAYAYFKAKAGEVTGRAPKDPAMKSLWLQDHKEYSIKVNGRWVSYRRGDPLFTPLGLVADGMMIADEASRSGGETDAGDVITSTMAAIAASFSNKTYMQGMTQFFEAWSSGEGAKMDKWLYGIGTGFTAPSGVSAMNTDPYYREVDSFIEATMSRYPGLSETLSARYNLFGEPEARYASVSPFPDKGPANETVATDLLSINKGFASAPRKVEGVDLGDRSKFAKDGVTPWDRMQELLREPSHGRTSLRDKLTELVTTPKWQNASEGTIQYPGGERWQMAANVIDAYQTAALRQVEKEFPALRDELKLQRKLRGASFRNGQTGVEKILDHAGR